MAKAKTLELQLYSPHKAQLRFHVEHLTHRYVVAAWGRQSGKSTGSLNNDLKFAWEHPETTTWFVSPTYDQARVQYRRLSGMLFECPDILLKKNQTELRIKLINQSQIRFVSGESYQNLRGETLHKATIDEMRDQPKELWPMVIRPMLATTKGGCTFISTPNGYDDFYELAEHAKHDETGAWSFTHAPSTANPLFDQSELEAAKAQMPEAIFAQEILAEFRDLTSGKAYLNFGAHNLMETSPFSNTGDIISPFIPVVLGCDFNLSPMAWTLGQHRNGQWYFFDEIWLKDSHTQEASRELIARLSDYRARGLLKSKPEIIIAGDATSKAGQRAAAGESDYSVLLSMLREAGFTFENRTPDSNPHVKDRVNTVNAKCKSASSQVSLWVNPKRCPMLKKDLERVVWKKGATVTLDQTTNPDLTHASDGIGYAICTLSPMGSIHEVGGLRILRH